MKYYRTIKQIAIDSRPDLESVSEKTGLWIYGTSGCGKSKKAREDHPDAYIKGMNKWWDGYAGEDVVILEDIDPTNADHMRRNLKIWLDHYPFPAESKGNQRNIRPRLIIVTSQYPIEGIWPDAETRTAIKRRCEVINMTPDGPLPDIIKKMYDNNKIDY